MTKFFDLLQQSIRLVDFFSKLRDVSDCPKNEVSYCFRFLSHFELQILREVRFNFPSEVSNESFTLLKVQLKETLLKVVVPSDS